MSDSTLLEQLEQALGAQYTVERELGGGGMSRVFLATELSLQRKVVIKVLPAELAATVNVERFRREIQLAAQLQHPLIVPVLSSGIMNGLPYYTMPFIEGESLRAKLSRDRELPLGEAVRILRDVVSALSYAHEKGVVHRDIKPDNVMLTRHHALVTDFGVAKALSAATNPGNSLTSMGVALGTPAYMSPEQATADPATDHRADIYAVGATAYEMITGRQLFSGRSPQAMLAAQAVETPEAIEKHRPSVSPVLSTLVMRTLEKHAADRPQTAEEMLHVLDALATPSGGMTPTMTIPVRPAQKQGSQKMIYAGVAIAVLAVAGFGASKVLSRPAVLDGNKVIVAPFQNKTGDAKFDQLSTLATDWVARGIVETGVVDIGQFTPQKDASGKIADNAFDVANLVKQAKALAAGRIVAGAFYKQGDSIQFQAQIIDANDGKLVGSIPPAIGPSNDPMSALNEMRARVMGSLAQMTGSEKSGLSSIDAPPSYEAFKEFSRGQEMFDRGEFEASIPFYFRAAKIDTTYFAPLVRAAYAFDNAGKCGQTDSLGKVLNAKRERLSDYEGYYLDRVIAWCNGDLTAAYVAAKQIARIAPKSSSAAYIAARSAPPINRLNEAAAAFDKLNLKKPQNHGYYRDYGEVLHMLGRHDEELKIVRIGEQAYPDRILLLISEVRALAALNRVDETRSVVARSLTMGTNSSNTPAGVFFAAVAELAAHGHEKASKEVAEEAIAWLRRQETRGSRSRDTASSRRKPSIAYMLLQAGRFAEAKALADSALSVQKDCIVCMSTSGQASALLGRKAEAETMVVRLLAMDAPFMSGENIYSAAGIKARLGEKADAVQLLRESISKGMYYSRFNDADASFFSLRGYKPFDDLLKSAD